MSLEKDVPLAGTPVSAAKTKPLVTQWLENAHGGVFALYAVVMAFTTYACMYSYRKPFAAATFDGQDVWGFDLKAALVLSQLLGYTLSKYLGVKFLSEMAKERRTTALIFLILWAEAALLLFAIVPAEGKLLAIFLNGLPLGAVWGLVFSYLEGRKTSEILGAGLSCSYIVSSAEVKAIGASLMDSGISESWMPVTTGLLFFPAFVIAVIGLRWLPPPTPEDIALRVDREPMDKAARRSFFRSYMGGLLFLIFVYFFLTAIRDYRDNFMADIWRDMGNASAPDFTAIDTPVAFSVMFVLALLYLIKNNRMGLAVTYLIMIAGSALIGVATLLFDGGAIGGMTWLTLVGLGLYLAYVPFGCVLFDRMIAALGAMATAVFLIYLTDAAGYSGSVGGVLYKELGASDTSKLDFFRHMTYAGSAIATVGFTISLGYFMRRIRRG